MTEGNRVDRRWFAAAATLLAAVLLWVLLPASTGAATSGFQEFPIAESGSSPEQIVAGPDGRLWYTTDQQAVEAMGTSGVATPYPATGTGAGSTGIADASNGTVAFMQGSFGNYPDGSISEASASGTLAQGPSSLQAGPGVSLTTSADGNLWWVSPAYVCRIGPSLDSATQRCVALNQSSPGQSVGATGIAAGSDGDLWVTEADEDAIVRVDPALPQAGGLTSFTLPSHGPAVTSRPFDIAAGPGGALWFTEIAGNRIGRITTGGQITEFDLPTANSDPEGISQGPDGATWFTEEGSDRIGRITASGQITEYPVPTSGAQPTAIASGPDGALWFTEAGRSAIGRYLPAPAPAPPSAPQPPSARLAVASGGAVAGEIVALNPGSSTTPGGTITGYAYDFNGSGAYNATCPTTTPVAYKVFDTPGSHVIGLRVTNSSGLTSTTRLTVNVAGRPGPRSAALHNHGLASSVGALSQFWCGTAKDTTLGSLGYLPLNINSEVHAVGIDVTQGVVPSPPRPAGLAFVSRINAVGGGRVSSGPALALNNDAQDPNANKIDWLQQFGTTVVRVYASALLAPNGTDVPNVQMKLYALRNGHDLPGSPLLSQTGPLDVRSGPPFTTHAMRVGYSPAAGNIPAFTFTLPANWVDQEGNLSLLAVPELVGSRLDRQCSTTSCQLAEHAGTSFQLNSTGLFIIRSVAMETTAQTNGTAGAPSFPDPWKAFDAAADIAPVAVFPSPYQGTINIDSIAGCKAGDKSTPCTNPNGYATTLIANWLNDNQPVIPATVKVATIGVHNGYSQINGYSSWPGSCADNANGGALCESTNNSPLSQVDASRPLTSVAHEMFHDLGRPHADATTGGCGGNGEGNPDAKGDTEAIGLDRHPGSGGSVTNPYKLLSPDLPTQPSSEYDLMSYCTDNYPETNSWMSAHTWNTVASDWIFFLKRAAASVLAHALTSRAAGPELQITGVSEGTSTMITHVEPAAGGAVASIASAPASSPYHAVIRNGSGAVVGNVPLTVTYGHLDGRTHLTPVAVFNGTVPAAGADSAQVTLNGNVIASMRRSAHAPTVRLLTPRRGTIGKRRRVLVHWSSRDSDGGTLTAYVDYTVNGGRSWRTVYAGKNAGRVSLPSQYFTGSTNARVRIRVNDGFNETRVVSGRLRAVGSPPTVTILAPAPGQRVTAEAATLLRGSAFDDAFSRLTGRRLTWFAERRRLGAGEMVTARGLPTGRVKIRLLARDRRGRVGSAQVTVHVVGQRPFFTTLIVPSKLSRRARRLRLRAATNIAATVGVAGHSFAVSLRTRTLSVPIKPGKRTLIVKLGLSGDHRSAQQTVSVRRP